MTILPSSLKKNHHHAITQFKGQKTTVLPSSLKTEFVEQIHSLEHVPMKHKHSRVPYKTVHGRVAYDSLFSLTLLLKCCSNHIHFFETV